MNNIFKLSLRRSHVVCDLTVFVFELKKHPIKNPAPMLQATFCSIDWRMRVWHSQRRCASPAPMLSVT